MRTGRLLDSTGKRLGASFGLVLALMLAVAGASWFALEQNRRASDQMVNAYLPLVFEMETLQKAHLRVSVLVRDIASHSDYAVQKQSIAALQEQSRLIDTAIDSLRRKAAAAGGADVLGMDEVIASKERTSAVLGRALELIKIAQYDEASQIVYNELRPIQLAVSEQLDRAQDTLVKQVAGTAQSVSERSASSLRAIVAGTLFALAVGILASIWITRSITRPLNAALDVANQVAAGDLTAAIEVTSQRRVRRVAERAEDHEREPHADGARDPPRRRGDPLRRRGSGRGQRGPLAAHRGAGLDAGGDRRRAWRSSPATVRENARQRQPRRICSRSRPRAWPRAAARRWAAWSPR